MRDWIVILLIGLAGAGALGWVLARRKATASMVAQPDATLASVSLADPVPNTSISQLPENRPIGALEFEGPPGSVTLQPGEIVIGRHSDDDVRIPDVRVSRHHARLIASAGRCEISNLTVERPDPNPMLINGERREHASVADGDVVTLGGVSFKLRLKTG